MTSVNDLAADALRSITSFPKIVPQILSAFIPYSLVLAAFGAFVVWNGGIVLGASISKLGMEYS